MSAKSRILQKLRVGNVTPMALEQPVISGEVDLSLWQQMLEANHAEVYRCKREELPQRIDRVMAERDLQGLIYGEGPYVDEVKQASCPLIPFKCDFDIPLAGVTSSIGGIADTGTIVVQPTAKEPRTLSLVPQLHIVIVEANKIVANMACFDWPQPMPTNLLFISGPSKTADIQQTLAYGAHGPSELVVLVI